MPRDSFNQAAPVAAASVKKVEIILTITEAIPAQGDLAAVPRQYVGRYSFDQLAADDTIVDVRQGNLIPYLTAAQKTSIQSFLDQMLTKAQGTI